MNTGASWRSVEEAEARVLGIQRKLHKWAIDDQARRFDDLHNLVCDPATMLLAWRRVRGNRGSRSGGVDGQTAYHVEQVLGVQQFLDELREQLRSGAYRPVAVRERMIPKRGGKRRRLGIPTVADRVVQAALKTVLEPIFEVDFQPCSYGFRPGRRTQDAIAEIHYLASRSYEWIVEADIEACFDRIDHPALLDRVRGRIADKRVLALIKAFLKAGIMTEHGDLEASLTGTPQGGILSPLLANIALSALDDDFARAWAEMGANAGQRQRRRRRGEATYRLVRYADDFVILVAGDRRHANALVAHTRRLIKPLGLRPTRPPPRLHLPLPAVASGGHEKGQARDANRPRSDARPAAAPAQPGTQRLVRLLPSRGVQAHLQLPARLHLAAGDLLAAPQVLQGELALDAGHPPSRLVAHLQRRRALQPRRRGGLPLPLPRHEDPDPMANR